MERCHLCGAMLPHHDEECRAHRDLALFARVYRRLVAESRNPRLQAGLARHLSRHGRHQDVAAA